MILLNLHAWPVSTAVSGSEALLATARPIRPHPAPRAVARGARGAVYVEILSLIVIIALGGIVAFQTIGRSVQTSMEGQGDTLIELSGGGEAE